jgi:hypothetical protein
MFSAHFGLVNIFFNIFPGIAFLLKGFNQDIPLNLLFASSIFPDFLCMFNIIAQLEFIQFDKKLLGKIFPYYIEFEYSHSLFVILLIGIVSIFLFVSMLKKYSIQDAPQIKK